METHTPYDEALTIKIFILTDDFGMLQYFK
jgi:hypothetical protein